MGREVEAELTTFEKSDDYRIRDVLTTLAELEGESDDALSERKWLVMSLEWGLNEAGQLPDPLAYVEEVYAAFDYPEDVSAFIRYMPPKDGYRPEHHSVHENHDRLMRLWRDFVQRERSRLFEHPH